MMPGRYVAVDTEEYQRMLLMTNIQQFILSRKLLALKKKKLQNKQVHI